MAQPLRCCSCNINFQTQDEISNHDEHHFHFECHFDFSLDPRNANLPCDHLAGRAVVVDVSEDSEAQPLNVQNAPEEDTSETRFLACALVCSALGVSVLIIKLLSEAMRATGYTF